MSEEVKFSFKEVSYEIDVFQGRNEGTSGRRVSPAHPEAPVLL